MVSRRFLNVCNAYQMLLAAVLSGAALVLVDSRAALGVASGGVVMAGNFAALRWVAARGLAAAEPKTALLLILPAKLVVAALVLLVLVVGFGVGGFALILGLATLPAGIGLGMTHAMLGGALAANPSS